MTKTTSEGLLLLLLVVCGGGGNGNGSDNGGGSGGGSSNYDYSTASATAEEYAEGERGEYSLCYHGQQQFIVMSVQSRASQCIAVHTCMSSITSRAAAAAAAVVATVEGPTRTHRVAKPQTEGEIQRA